VPYRKRRASYGPRPVVNSIKNVTFHGAGMLGTVQNTILAKAVTSPAPTNQTDVSHGCIIKAIFVSLDLCGLGGTGVLNNASAYLMKNPGNNLTPPSPFSQGTSNEKKFIIKSWHAMIMRIQDGPNPYHWEGWIKIPKRYQRMGTDDIWQVAFINTATLTGHFSMMTIYKWLR